MSNKLSNNKTDANCYTVNPGVCQPVPTMTPVDVKVTADTTNRVYRYAKMNWWSAASLCNTNHNGLIIPSDLGISNGNTPGTREQCQCVNADSLLSVCTINCAKGTGIVCWEYLRGIFPPGTPGTQSLTDAWTAVPMYTNSDNSISAITVVLGCASGNVLGLRRHYNNYNYALCR